MKLRGSLWCLFLVGCAAEVAGPTPPGPDAPVAPTDLTAAPLAGGVHLTWQDRSSDESTFELERRSGTSEFTKIASLVFDSAQFHDAAVSPGGHYVYRVRAMGDAGSAWSNEASIDLPPAEVPRDGGTLADASANDASTGADAGGPAELSFRQDVVPIFQRSCGTGNSMCHATNAYAAWPDRGCRGWLSLVDEPLGRVRPDGTIVDCPDRTLYQRLTDLDSWMCEPVRRYIVPGSLADSQIYSATAGDSSAGGSCNRAPNVPLGRMPPPTAPYTLDGASLSVLRRWIEAGAPNN